MKATLYKELSNKKTPIELPAGKSIKEAMPDLDLDNAIIVINGRIEKPDYILKENDIAAIRLTPAAMTTVAIIAIAVVAVGAAIVGGIALYNAKQAAEKAQKELEKIKKLTNKSDIDNRPFLRGASNTLATGNSQPYIIGRHFFTPYLLCKPFYKITGTDGADEYTYTVLECGFNRQIIQKIAIDDITIKTFAQTAPQEGSFNLDTGVFAEDGRVEIAQDGALLTDLPELNYKVESKACNDEIPHDSDVKAGTKEHLTYTLNPYAKDVDIAITFPYGLYAMNDGGDKIETQVTITPQYSLDGGSTWQDFTFNNNGIATNTFRRKVSAKELRFVAHNDFTAADYNTLKANGQGAIYIRILNNGNKDSTIHNGCYCLFYQSVCFDPDKSMGGKSYTNLIPCKVVEDRERAFCTILGLKLKASKINEDKLKKINIITQGVARTWNGSKWSATKTATRNPAAWALEIETSDSHPASRYDDSEMDLDSFGDYHEFCEQNGYRFDYVITQNMKKDDVLNYIMEATGACIYTDIYGRRAVAFDRPQENALAVYNPQNIIDIQNKKTFGRKTDALRIKWVNGNDDLFQEDTYLLMREVNGVPLTLNENSIIKDITVTGITTFDHVVKYARRLMAVEILRPKTTIIEVGNEGIFYTPLSKILIQDDSLKIGIGKGYTIRECVWRGGLLKKIYTNEPLAFDPQKSYGIIVNCFTADSVKPVAIKIEGTGATNELTVLTSIRTSADYKPEAGNIFSFGELDIDGEFSKVTTEYLISDIKRSDKGFTLDLVNYNEAVYDSGTIPTYKSNMTKKAAAEKKGIPADTVTHEELLETVATADGTKAAQEAANEVVHGVHFTNIHRIKDMELSLEEILARIDSDRAEAAAGISVSEEEILIKVADTEAGLYSAIDLTKTEILSTVADTERELRAILDIQSSAVTALVQGGGAQGKLALSLELPAMIDDATHKKFSEKCGEAETAAVYARLAGTDFHAIKGNAGGTAVKNLWNRAVKARLLASQVQLNADQIVVQNGDKTAAAFIDGKLRAACIDAENLIVQQLKIDSDKNSDQDFEAYFDKIRGLQIKNRGADILKVDPKTGEAFFTGKVQAGAVELAHGGVFIRNGEISIENNGWKGVLRPCEKGVELAILGGDGGNMTKRQLWTYIAGGVLNLFVLGSITSCGGMYNSSPDGTLKNKRSGTKQYLRSVAYANNIWLATGEAGTILKSTDNGNSWTKKNSDTNVPFSGISYGSNSWVTVGDKGTILKSTDDGETWTKLDSGTDKHLTSIAYGNNTWIAVGANGAILKSTNNGETWTKHDIDMIAAIFFIAYGNSTWIATDGTGNIYKSTDNGETWTKKISGTNLPITSVLYSSNTWIAGGELEIILKSTDNGETWTKKNSGTDRAISAIAYGNGTWIAPDYGGAILKSTDDGETWTKLDSGTKDVLRGIATDDVTFVAVGGNGTILSSTDAVHWE